MTDLLSAAVGYAERGWAVFPLRPRHKAPYGRTVGYLSASSDPAIVRAWWAGELALQLKPPEDEPDQRPVYARPNSNIGIATGAVSGFWVYDEDGPEADLGTAALTDVHGELPATVQQQTPGGRHRLFAWDQRFDVRNSASKIGPKIDVRGNGGYIVAPPSLHPGDEKRGIPAGKPYAWCARRAPSEIAFAPAPDWLLQLAAPPEAQVERRPVTPHVAREGRASAYGEACLSTSCRKLASSPVGQQQDSLWSYGVFIGSLIAGGEIERSYGRDALIDAGLQMTPGRKPWLRKEVETHIDRGLERGERDPRTAPERRDFQPATPWRAVSARSPAQAAVDIRDARSLWASARSADCGAFRSWLKLRGLDPRALPATMARLRAHPAAPVGGDRRDGAILVPLVASSMAHDDWAEVDALAVIPLRGDHNRPTHFVGDRERKVALLSEDALGGDLLVALELADLWALGSSCAESGHDLGLVLAPTLGAFAGGWLGDRYSRSDPELPHADPDRAPWTTPGKREVWLALRGDLRTPEIRSRRTWGGTRRGVVQGEAAARFYGGLAEQAWRRAGATKVHSLRPNQGVSFSQHWGN